MFQAILHRTLSPIARNTFVYIDPSLSTKPQIIYRVMALDRLSKMCAYFISDKFSVVSGLILC